jgi:hypothetical protein
MFGSEVLDVAVGLILVFLLLSLMATAVREGIESFVKLRAVYLERGIRELFADEKGNGMALSFYQHPLICSLFKGPFEYRERRRIGGSLPTYIPSRNFADAVIDLAIRGPVQPEYAAVQVAPDLSVAALRANVGKLKNPMLIRAVLTAIDHSDGDMAKVRKNIGAWYDSAMDRVSGWYKRRTQLWLFAIGLALAAALNVDTVRLTNHLSTNKALRESLVARAEALARDTTYQRMLRDTSFHGQDVQRTSRDLGGLELPIGWSDSSKREMRAQTAAGVGAFLTYWIWALLGFLPAALAVTLGAPFWFDALNKFMVVRSTVKPHEKSPEESSEDRQKEPAKPSTTTVTPPADGRKSAVGTATAAAIITAAAAVAAGPKDDEAPPNEWAAGDPEEGIL